MQAEPSVSIVLPVYNQAAFIRSALRSVIEQSYGNIELIVVNDGSTDDTPQVVARFLDSASVRRRPDRRVVFVSNDRNLGAHAAINRGLELATGEYLGILNADDCFSRERIARLVENAAHRKRWFAFGSVTVIDADGNDITNASPLATRMHFMQRSIVHFPSVGFACLASNVAISTGNFFFDRAIFEKLGRFSDLRYCHDWDYLLRCVLCIEPSFVPQAEYFYRLHDANGFLAMENLRVGETESVLGAYFCRVQAGQLENPLAPCPQFWPGVFEMLMNEFGLWKYWELARRTVGLADAGARFRALPRLSEAFPSWGRREPEWKVLLSDGETGSEPPFSGRNM